MTSKAQNDVIALIKNSPRKELLHVINESGNPERDPEFAWYVNGQKVNKSTAVSLKNNGFLRLKGVRRDTVQARYQTRLDVYTLEEVTADQDVPFYGKIHPGNPAWEAGDRFVRRYDARQRDTDPVDLIEKCGEVVSPAPQPIAIQFGKTTIQNGFASLAPNGWIFVREDSCVGYMGTSGILPENFNEKHQIFVETPPN
jgi:hypothetical protein